MRPLSAKFQNSKKRDDIRTKKNVMRFPFIPSLSDRLETKSLRNRPFSYKYCINASEMINNMFVFQTINVTFKKNIRFK